MRLSRLLSQHNQQMRQIFRNQSVNHFNLYATIWKVLIFQGTPAFLNCGKKSATDQKRWQISKNDLFKLFFSFCFIRLIWFS
jgi:hypothetical protein